jgi:leucyl aminopeptidase
MVSAPVVRLTSIPLSASDADVIVLPVFESDALDDVPQLDAAARGEILEALSRGEFRARPYDLFSGPRAGGTGPRLLCVGGGTRADWSGDRLRKVAAAAGLAARQRALGRIGWWHRASIGGTVDLEAVTEGFVLAAFDGDTWRTSPRESAALTEVALVVPAVDPPALAAVERGWTLGDCTNRARAMANEPGNALPPRVLAERAVEAVAGTGIEVEVLDEARLAELGMGLLLGVGQGSAEPPRLIVMRYAPPDCGDGPVLGLVGKGVTFDTGGISIKPADGMDRMKTDMSGGAAVVGAMRAIGLLKPRLRVVGLVPAAENMPGGRAIRPGDVLRSASGKTVEVNNTDAEGRLILADALWYAQQLGATHLVDVATLTGACVVALGRYVSGLFAAPDSWAGAVAAAAQAAGDRVWRMPLDEDFKEALKSEIADLLNTGGRPAGAVTAAMFLKEFTGGLPWAHLDVAGTAWADDAKPWQPKGTTGVAVSTLARLALTVDRWAAR